MRHGFGGLPGWLDGPVVLVGHEEPCGLHFRYGAAYGSADISDVEEGLSVFRLEDGWRETCSRIFVGQCPGGKRGVFVVVKERAVVFRSAALGGDANVGDAGVFSAESVGENIEIADGFQGGLALRGLTEDAAV